MFTAPSGMSRRHFMSHMAGASALTIPALTLGNSLMAHADTLKRNKKSAILLWMSGGPSTMDIWDLKPGASTGGPFRPISTAGDVQICEHMPLTAQVMDKLSIVRSMSTREADHMRGRYYMHTGYVPNATIEHPSYGAVLSHELISQRPELQIPPFISVGGGSVGPGFLGMAWAPFTVNSNGQIRNLDMKVDSRLVNRMRALDMIEKNFIGQNRGSAAEDHSKMLKKTADLLTSPQMEAFKVAKEPKEMLDMYGTDGFARGCLMARRLVEAGVPFVEVDFGGWDNHAGIFPTFKDDKLPKLDRAMSSLVTDLDQRGLLEDTAIIWMGEFSRTPTINGGAGRDHWARSWSVVLGGAGMKGGIAVGKTSEDGRNVESDEPYTSQDVMATVCKALGISLETTFTSRSGRPMKIAAGGKVIKELFA